ncbi:TIGR03943 family putative permease subunit [Streptomyces sp. NRRL S-118]|uniref:TIGR03943 family putative permease subunit n=1 Tax=Streptomyces sp. NRRL S-118 TaxID=1463881 RepID=UPI002D21EC20|nr:TIGR03943 family protein [Streptomyces sp. NRRL S-118]
MAAVKGRFQALLLVLTGAAVLRISLLSEVYLRYVKAGLRPLLIATGAVLLVLGLLAAVREARSYARARLTEPEDEHPVLAEPEDGHAGHGHDHAHGPRVAWLLYVPAVMLLLFAPPALGSYTAARDDVMAASRTATFPDLPATGPVPMAVRDFSARAIYDTEHSLRGRTVRLTGFVTPGDDGRWYLSRLLIQCCAADAGVMKVEVFGMRAPAADTWVTVTGVWRPLGSPGSEEARPALDATGLEKIPEPTDPYDDRPPADAGADGRPGDSAAAP